MFSLAFKIPGGIAPNLLHLGIHPKENRILQYEYVVLLPVVGTRDDTHRFKGLRQDFLVNASDRELHLLAAVFEALRPCHAERHRVEDVLAPHCQVFLITQALHTVVHQEEPAYLKEGRSADRRKIK